MTCIYLEWIVQNCEYMCKKTYYRRRQERVPERDQSINFYYSQYLKIQEFFLSTWSRKFTHSWLRFVNLKLIKYSLASRALYIYFSRKLQYNITICGLFFDHILHYICPWITVLSKRWLNNKLRLGHMIFESY